MTSTAALLQLSSASNQDAYITINPEVNLFKYVARRVTKFVANPIPLPFNERLDYGKTLTCDLPANKGDMIYRMQLYFKLPALQVPSGSTYANYTNSVGFALIEEAEIVVGGITVDRQSGLFMEVMDYVSTPPGERVANNMAVGRYDSVSSIVGQTPTKPVDVFVRLQFWFNQKLSMALPMVALNKTPVKLRFKLRNFNDIVVYDGDIPPTIQPLQDGYVITEYIYLPEDHRKYVKGSKHTYLIEQRQELSQSISPGSAATRLTLDFSHPIKELIWVLVETESEDNNDYFNFGSRSNQNLTESWMNQATLYLDGKKRTNDFSEAYWRLITMMQYHTYSGDRNIYVNSFCEKPEQNAPSGACLNFSRFDQVVLDVQTVPANPQLKIYVLAVNYNVFTINEGKGYLMFNA